MGPSSSGGIVYMGEFTAGAGSRRKNSKEKQPKGGKELSLRGHHKKGLQNSSSTAGDSSLYAGPELSPYQLFPRGTYFGDLELFLATPRLTCSRCEVEASVVLILSKKELLSL